MTTDLKLAIIGLDTSHAPIFTGMFMQQDNPHHVPGVKITEAFPGGSPSFSLSRNRIAGYTAELREKHGIKMVEKIADFSPDFDGFLLLSADGRQHLAQLTELSRFGKPVFIDKPFACSAKEAGAMAKLAAERGIRIASSSSIPLAKGLADMAPPNTVVHGVEAFGPMSLLEDYPSYFWYGVHSAHVLFALMGVGCREVRTCHKPDQDVIAGIWADGRIGTLRGCRFEKAPFGATAFTADGVRHGLAASEPPPYKPLLDAIVRFIKGEPFPIPLAQTIEAMAFLEAAEISRQNAGAPIALATL